MAYCFTDIGQSMVERARQSFAAHGFMSFRRFDLEGDAADQGFEPESFDIIIAANVVHATADLRRTLGQLNGLLAPGGALFLLEVTGFERWIDLTFGLTEGWWRFNGPRPALALPATRSRALARRARVLRFRGGRDRSAAGRFARGTARWPKVVGARPAALGLCWARAPASPHRSARIWQRSATMPNRCLLLGPTSSFDDIVCFSFLDIAGSSQDAARRPAPCNRAGACRDPSHGVRLIAGIASGS